MSYEAEQGGPPGPERRQRTDVRAIFNDAVVLVAPFFHAAGGVPMDYWAARALREAYPELDTQGFQILMAAVSRVFHNRAGMSGCEAFSGTTERIW